MDVKIIRLISGEDIIAEVATSGNTCLELKNPMLIGLTEQGLGTAPLSLVADTKEVSIKREHILFVAPPEEEILNAYKSKFGGIVTPRSLIT